MTEDFDINGDRLREECGVFGVYGHPDAAALTALGLHALQHRGQEAAGIVTFDGERFNAERRMGLVGDHFSSEKVINRLQGRSSLGHVRYSTTGETILRNVEERLSSMTVSISAGASSGRSWATALRRSITSSTMRIAASAKATAARGGSASRTTA